MNDYKDLIAELRNFTIVGFNNNKFPIVRYPSKLERNAADIIEQLAKDIDVLTKERDAAVADLNKARSCITCKSDSLDFCEGCDSWRSKCNWEWRGVQE